MFVRKLMFCGDVGPMSSTRSPLWSFRYFSSACQPLECRGMRGPVSVVGRSPPASSRFLLKIPPITLPHATARCAAVSWIVIVLNCTCGSLPRAVSPSPPSLSISTTPYPSNPYTLPPAPYLSRVLWTARPQCPIMSAITITRELLHESICPAVFRVPARPLFRSAHLRQRQGQGTDHQIRLQRQTAHLPGAHPEQRRPPRAFARRHAHPRSGRLRQRPDGRLGGLRL